MSKDRYHYIVRPVGGELEQGVSRKFELIGEYASAPAALYRLKESNDDLGITSEQNLIELGHTRIFENYWLPNAISDQQRAALIQALFSFIGQAYESIVTRDLNVHCYDHIYNLAFKRLGKPPARVLDFGCGTGLITELPYASQIPYLRGLDFCPTMISIAEEKGLKTLTVSLQDLSKNDCFDAILASYVFHYKISTHEWLSLFDCISDRGCLIGNFHKGIGLQEAVQTIEQLNLHCCYDISNSNFGPVLAITRGRRG